MNTNKEQEYNYIRLPKSICEKIKQLENPENFILDYIELSKRDIMSNFEAFDDEILTYRGNMAKLKSEFKKVVDEALDANYKVWEDFDKQRKSIRAQVDQMKKELEPLTKELEEISGLMSKVNSWNIQHFLDMLTKIQGHLYGEDRKILEFLINNYGKVKE